MTKPAFLLVHRHDNNAEVVIQVAYIAAFGPAYKDITGGSGYFIQCSPRENDTQVTMSQSGCWVIRETTSEIMALIDKAQALVHALEQ